MTKQVQFRRGTATQHTSFTGVEGEITVNTTNKSAHVHDGLTAGGLELARKDLSNVSGSVVASTISGNTVSALTVTTATVNGGTINNAAIGATTRAAGNFTSINANAASVISVNSSSDAMRITQAGSGNAFVVEDSANPDSTPFVIDTTGRVLISYNGVSSDVGALTIEDIDGSVNSGINLVRQRASAASEMPVRFQKSRNSSGAKVLVSSGDTIGSAIFQGYDGAAFVSAGTISGQADATAASGSMPGRLTFSTTASGASTPTERMRITSTGSVGIGTTPAANRSLTVAKSLTGAVNAFGVTQEGVVQSDVTSGVQSFRSSLGTAAASFTIGSITHYTASQATFGAGSFVTNQTGYSVENSLVGSANNYGFRGQIALGTSRTITTIDRTTNVVTVTTSVAHGYTVGQSVTVAAVTNTGVNGTFTITAVPTTTTFSYAQTGTDITSGADTGSTVVVGRWNAYMDGTAPNYFNGSVGVGTTTPINKLDIVGSFGRGAPVTKTGNFTLAATENWLIVNNATANTTITLPAASLWTGREIMLKNLSATYTVISASSNVVPVDSATAGTAILGAGAGKNCTLVSDGTNWIVMRSA